MIRYVLGFVFNEDLTKVCLIKKNRPKWQAGLLNGVGGKIDKSETPLEAMIREFKEETGVMTRARQWSSVACLKFIEATVEVFAFSEPDILDYIKTTTDEEVGVYSYDSLELLPVTLGGFQQNLVDNVPALLQLSFLRLTKL